MMKKLLHVIVSSFVLAHLSFVATAAEDGAVKNLSGISIVGNKETPKSLYIVPWKSSDIGMETDLSSSLLNEGLHAVDKDVFQRELDFFEISNSN